MSGPNLPAEGAPLDVGARFDEIAAAIESVRSELAQLRAELAGEIRTRRVVLVESDGFERMVITAEEQYAQATLFSRSSDERSTCVELFANDSIEDHGAHVGVALTERGDVVAALEVVERHEPSLWLGHDGDRRSA